MRPIMRRLARRYRHTGHVEDLEQAAALGLTKALERFDPAFGTDFVRYAVPTMIGEMRRWLRDHSWAVRPPREAAETWLELCRPPSASARHSATRRPPRTSPSTSTSPSSASSPPMEARRGRWALSLDAPVHADTDDRTLGDQLGMEDEGLRHAFDRAWLDELWPLLEPLERDVMRAVLRRRPVPARDRPAHGHVADEGLPRPAPRGRAPARRRAQPPPRSAPSRSSPSRRRPAGAAALARQPVAELLADVADRRAGLGEGVGDALGVVRLGGVGLVAQRRLLAAADVVAADDAVVAPPRAPSPAARARAARASGGSGRRSCARRVRRSTPLPPSVVHRLRDERVEAESAAASPAAMTMSARHMASGSRVTSAAARSQLSSAPRNHSSSASWIASSGSPASSGSRAEPPSRSRMSSAVR